MARLRHEKARLVRMSDTPTIRGFFIDLSNMPQSHTTQGLEPYFRIRDIP